MPLCDRWLAGGDRTVHLIGRPLAEMLAAPAAAVTFASAATDGSRHPRARPNVLHAVGTGPQGATVCPWLPVWGGLAPVIDQGRG